MGFSRASAGHADGGSAVQRGSHPGHVVCGVQFVPVLKLLCEFPAGHGVFDDDDVLQILLLIDPSVLGSTVGREQKGGGDAGGGEGCGGWGKGQQGLHQGLLQTRLPESVKLQVTQGSQHPAFGKN